MNEWNWELIIKQENLTEGPAWNGNELLYSQCSASLTWAWNPDTNKNTIWRKNTNGSNGMLFDKDGNLYACEGEGRRLALYKKNEATITITDNFQGKKYNEPNDLAIHPDGNNIWFSDPNYGGRKPFLDHESVYLAHKNSDNSWYVSRATFDTTRPNGVLLSKDTNFLYVAESPYGDTVRRQFRSYPVNKDKTFGDHTVLHDFGEGRGIDGMCLDTEGNILATAGHHEAGPGPMIYHFTPSGRVMTTYNAPADKPTNCSFGGENLDILFITFAGGEVYQVKNTGLKGHLLFP